MAASLSNEAEGRTLVVCYVITRHALQSCDSCSLESDRIAELCHDEQTFQISIETKQQRGCNI